MFFSTRESSRRWADLPQPVRIGMVAAGSAEAVLRVWSLIDLARRPAAQVRGPKALWGLSLMVVNSVGVLPLIYLTKGRRR